MSEITNSDGSTGSTVSTSGTIHDFYDPACDGSIDYTIVTTVAAARKMDPIDLPPIYESVDVDALGALVAGACDRPDGVDGRVTFTYAGYAITVDFDGLIRFHPSGGTSTDGS